ncbi:hypothetical protein I2486_01010 [Cellulophaga sp. E16_2]|uniref:Lipoprotein n=1 Tax=Cellulophaga algicola (strain DSM 14237 / IC166 / ACAM 630) TaxID=688270 RepID=E6X8M5_CELAD|nr:MULTISPECIES: hypothetical protein [Cellulophaga]ADV47612.1 hypothetical protein Celal_0266 [Cellulophaga algicola DSM 14237]MBO0589973.1 hypothetical protein [Cellulophaga sp. E16_2]
MKHIITALIFTGILFSCNSSEKSKDSKQESPVLETGTEEITIDNKTAQLKPINTDEALLATALMAAPEESRAACKVIGYNMAGEFVTMREGSNQYIVLADNPNQDGFNAACYHKDLEPFMARGRALRAEGKTGQEVFAIREAEMKSGQLKITPGLSLHILFGSKTVYDPETSKVEDAQLRYVVYMPWATSESIGLPEIPMAPNHPWIMNSGTHRAHIMISPLPEEKE